MKNSSQRRQQSDSFVQEAVYHIVRICQSFLCLKEDEMAVLGILVGQPRTGHLARVILGSADLDISARRVSGRYNDAEAAPGSVWEPGARCGGLVGGLFRASWVVARGSRSFWELCAEDVDLFDCGGF